MSLMSSTLRRRLLKLLVYAEKFTFKGLDAIKILAFNSYWLTPGEISWLKHPEVIDTEQGNY